MVGAEYLEALRESTEGDIVGALPNDFDAPPASAEVVLDSPVSKHVLAALGPPELDVGRRHDRKAAFRVLMPEAAMNEDGSSDWPEHDVRFAGQVGRV